MKTYLEVGLRYHQQKEKTPNRAVSPIRRCHIYKSCLCKLQEAIHAGKVFADDIKFEIDNGAHLERMKVGMLESIRDNTYLKGICSGTAYCERDTIDCDTALVHTEISTAHHFLVAFVLESKLI